MTTDRTLVVEVAAEGFDGKKFQEWLRSDGTKELLTEARLEWLPEAIQTVWGNLIILNAQTRQLFEGYSRSLESNLTCIVAHFMNTGNVHTTVWENNLLGCAELRRLVLDAIKARKDSVPEQVACLSGGHRLVAELLVESLGTSPEEEFVLRLLLKIFLHEKYVQCCIDDLKSVAHDLEDGQRG